MKINPFKTEQQQLLSKALDVHERQHKAIAQNIANASNPEYARVSTDFSKSLESAVNLSKVKTTSDKHISSSRFHQSGVQNGNGDNSESVDYTKEMTDMAENQIKHEFVSNALSHYFKGLSTAIVGRNR